MAMVRNQSGYILGIETSCDDTAVAVLSPTGRVLSSIVSSQDRVHAAYRGIVPELASRQHIESIVPIFETALTDAAVSLDQIGGIGVTAGPGLIGSLAVGVSFAKAVALGRWLPIVAINHLEGHVVSPFLNRPWPEAPFAAFVISGGHTHLYRVDRFGSYQTIGQTVDDAAGEAFDKVAAMMGLGFPGGPVLSKRAETGNPSAFSFPRARLRDHRFHLSFSGLKSAVARLWEELPEAEQKHRLADIAASFQQAVIDVIIDRLELVIAEHRLTAVALAGGVSCNHRLRQTVSQKLAGVTVYLADSGYCTDNAAMIAAAAQIRLNRGETSPLDFAVRSRWPL